ncbi:MAG: hypothetical protein UR98_C0001G0028 [Parcubacteria group bacterium GW2011_GWA1_36_12]|nr:MAG: hypothetical protein UR98_C0001G0028 [Parcubacteria group bacterium GW2011_GWA1_36_12]
MLQALALSNQLNQNTASAYKVFGECVTKPDTCDKEKTEKQLKELEQQKVQINAEIQKITNSLKSD